MNKNHKIPKAKLRVCIVQNSAGSDYDANIRRIETLSKQFRDPDIIALPEVFALRGSDEEYRRIAQPVPGNATRWISAMSKKFNACVLAGSIMEKAENSIFNTCVVTGRNGRTKARYRKIHLFEAYLPDGKIVRESDLYQAGNDPVMFNFEGWRCALSICYDVRFPELYRLYSALGAHIFFIPANFTQKTGKDHWETLVRARAVENQCFVVAPNQCGTNPATNIASYGNSMAVGPWGEILCRAGCAEKVMNIELNPADLAATRARIPALNHRRL